MINLYTPSDELWNVIGDEYEKAKYWMIKYFGGEKRYEAMRDDLLRRCAYAQHSLISEMVYYTSREGNRWVSFENVTYYPDSFAANAMPNCICFYETASSIGVFLTGFDNDSNMNSILIFTPHFFQRYSERLGIDGDKKAILENFVTSTRAFTISPMDDDDSGLERVAVRITNDYTGYGIRRSGDKNIFEVRTILTDAQLSKVQSARTERVRKLRKYMAHEPIEIEKRRLELSGNPMQAFNDKIKNLNSLGIDTSRQQNGLKFSFTISKTFMKMGIASIYNLEFWDKFHKESHDPIVFLLKRLEEEGKENMTLKEYVSLAREIAARLGIRKFAWREFAHIILVDTFKLSDTEATNAINKMYK